MHNVTQMSARVQIKLIKLNQKFFIILQKVTIKGHVIDKRYDKG